jgi:tetratricopeptide (TPR) repeat protein
MDQGNYELTSKLYQAENGALLMERTYSGTDLLNLLDSICHDSRISMGIKDDILSSTPDLPIAEMTTYNLNAYRLYAGIYDGGSFLSDANLISLYNAVQLDSTFAWALYVRAAWNLNQSANHRSALRNIGQAMRHRQRLSYYDDILTRRMYFLIHGETEKAIALGKMQVELHPYDYRFLETLALLYGRKQMFDQAEKAMQELNEMVPDHPHYMSYLARSLLINGKYSKGLETLDQWLLDDPMNTEALLMKGEFYLHMKDFKAAEEVIKRAIIISPEEEDKWSLLLDHIEYIQNNKKSKSLLESYTGKYTFGEQYATIIINNNQLYFWAENQTVGLFGYPVSDTVFVTAFTLNGLNVSGVQSFFKDKNGNVAGIEQRQSNYPNITYRMWKEYPLILKARKLFSEDKLTEALDTFLLARDLYPAHFYLSYYIQHLEYIQNMATEVLDSLFKSYAGKYNDIYLYTEDQKLFSREPTGFIYDLLSLTDSTFMVPPGCYTQVQMLLEDGRKTGLKFVDSDGSEEYYPRTVDPQTNGAPN